ncbi:MAG: hypothetical protein VYE19_08540, partial [Chloroflexota bacterium]|nr:hypothetical protein [Chloroflexota bacterium]MED5569699.1 hypothetical protein [Chloroflexota bacterium]
VFVQRLVAHFPNLKFITPPEGIKDASDMAVKMGGRFSDMMHELIDTAKQGTVKQSEVGIKVRRGANFTERRQSVADAYEYGGDADTATEILRCAVWRRAYQYGCGLVEGQTFHCGKRGCPNCTMMNLTRFFAEKMDIVEQISVPYLVEIPALYEVCVRGLGRESMAGEFSRGVSQVRKLLSDWTKYEGKKCDLAKNHIYSIRCAIDTSGVSRFGAVILGDTPVTPIASWFEKRLGRPLIMEEERDLQLTTAINRFKSLTATGFTWCTHDPFPAWCISQKSKKLIQGKGRFSGVSGSKATLCEPPATEIYPDHGVEEPVTRLRKIGPPEVWVPFISPHTQRKHYRLEGAVSSLITDDG